MFTFMKNFFEKQAHLLIKQTNVPYINLLYNFTIAIYKSRFIQCSIKNAVESSRKLDSIRKLSQVQ
jgi:hypothetical protein